MTDWDDRAEMLADLIAETVHQLETVDAYLARWPSSRIQHHRASLLDALHRERVDNEAKAQRAMYNAAAKVHNEVRRVYDPFDLEMAAKFKNPDGSVGLPIEEFMAWRDRRRVEMAKPQSQEEIDAVMRTAR